MKSLIKIFSSVLIVVFVFSIIITRCSEKAGKENSQNTEDGDDIIPVRVINIQSEKVEWGINVVGIIVADKGVDILSESGAKVTNVYFNLGDYVKKGKILVKLDDEYKKYDLIRAEAQLQSAKADLEKSELDLDRYQKISEAKGISQYDQDNIRLKRDVSKANYLTAESAYKTAKRQLEDTAIKSPFSGFISKKMVEVGNMTSIGTPAARIIDIRQIKLNVEVAEKDIIHIKVGDLIKITVDAYSNQEFIGEVTATSPEANMNTKTFPVEIKAKNTDDFKLKPGMVAKGKIITEVSENTFLLPQDVIIKKDGTNFVFLNEGDRAVENMVEAGRTYNNMVEVISGLNVNDKVITSGSEFLRDGVKIYVQN
ncbi:efflux RND transporter periplasmic adaptor subunit [candidate division KSB1 bacterium]